MTVWLDSLWGHWRYSHRVKFLEDNGRCVANYSRLSQMGAPLSLHLTVIEVGVACVE